MERQILAADRPRHRPLRSAAVGRDAALSDPGPRHRRRRSPTSTSCPAPNNKGSHVVGTAKAWVRRLDNSFFREPHRRPAVADDQPRARQRRDRPLHQPAALFAQAAAVGRGPAASRTAPSTSSPPAGRRNTARVRAGSRRSYRAAQARPLPRPAQRRARHHRHAPAARSDRRPASITARAADRGSGRSPATARSCCRTNAPTMIAIAALDAGGAHASGDLRSIPAASAAA